MTNIQGFSHFIFRMTLWGEYYICHVTDDDSEVWQISNFPKSCSNLLLPLSHLHLVNVTLLSPSCKETCDYIGRTQMISSSQDL